MLKNKLSIFRQNLILAVNFTIDFLFQEEEKSIQKDYFCDEFDVGKKLKNRREELEITILQISKNLKIKEEYVLLLEKNEVGLLTTKVYLSGFFKSYCRLLKIEDEVIDEYLKIITGFSSKNHLINIGYQEKQNPSRKYLANAAIALVVLYLFLMLFGKINSHNFNLTNLIIQNFSHHQEQDNEL